jgi:hypothetical protein
VSLALPDHRELGPDPEPMGLRLDSVDLRALVRRRRPSIRECPLTLAFGRHSPCLEEACIYHCVPGVSGHRCAVQAWAPEVANEPALAEWFLARRRERTPADEPGPGPRD